MSLQIDSKSQKLGSWRNLESQENKYSMDLTKVGQPNYKTEKFSPFKSPDKKLFNKIRPTSEINTGIKSKRHASSAVKFNRGVQDSHKTLIFCSINKELRKKLKSQIPIFDEKNMGHIIYQPTKSKILAENISKGSFVTKFSMNFGKTQLYKRPQKQTRPTTVLKHLRSEIPETFNDNKDMTNKPVWWKPYSGNASIQSYNKERDASITEDQNNFFRSTNYFKQHKSSDRYKSDTNINYNKYKNLDYSLEPKPNEQKNEYNPELCEIIEDKGKFKYKISDLQRIEDIARTSFQRIYSCQNRTSAHRNEFINNYLTEPGDYY